MSEEPRRKRQYVLLPRRDGSGRATRPERPATVRPEPPVAAREVESLGPDDKARGVFGKSRHEMIAEAAYYRSLDRACRGGDSDRDWIEAENEIDDLLRRTPLY